MRRTAALLLLAGCARMPVTPGGVHDLRQLTTNGTHAEAYWSPDGSKLVLMGLREGDRADQIYTLDLETKALTRISNGQGKKTCGYFLPDGRLIYSSTHHHSPDPPPPPDRSKGYGWPLYRTFDVFRREPDGSLTPLTVSDGYDAESTVSPDGSRIVFTSHREDSIGLWTMNVDGTDKRKVTRREGYAGGAFFSPDGRRLVYRAFYPDSEEERAVYRRMVTERMLRPVNLEIYLSNADGSDERQLTDNGEVNWAPVFHPDGRTIVFMSNKDQEKKRYFSLYAMNLDGSGIRRLTEGPHFDGFPHFSPDGRRLVFVSDRNATSRRDLNVFLADWR